MNIIEKLEALITVEPSKNEWGDVVQGCYDKKIDFDELEKLINQAKAEQSEPFGYVTQNVYEVTDFGTVRKQSNDVFNIPVYTAPQPTPKSEPFGYFKAEPFGWTDCSEHDEGAIALYEKTQPTPQASPLRIELGFGKYGIHNGSIEGVPCLTISNKGTGVVGEATNHPNMTEMELENEVVSITFASRESFDVFKKYVDAIDQAMKGA